MLSRTWKYLNSPELVHKIQKSLGVKKVDKKNKKKFRIHGFINKCFYYFFLVGTELGDEVFYGLFIPMFFFNLDAFIGRRFVFHWFVSMYVGGVLKQLFKEERPKKPAIQMQPKWSEEYSLPSTHAMGSMPIAASILYFAADRYNFDVLLGAVVVVLWVSFISMSRVYLGMHSVLDLVLGIVVSSFLLLVLLPMTNFIETFLVVNPFSPLLILVISIILLVLFPTTEKRTPTKGDTCTIAGVFTGIEIGSWFANQYGLMTLVEASYPLAFNYSSVYNVFARTILGLAIAGATEVVAKAVSLYIFCCLLNEDKETLKFYPNKRKDFVDLSSKYLAYALLGFNVAVGIPLVFKYFKIQREAFFTEL